MARFFYINKVKLIYMDNENMNEVVKDLSQRIAKDIFGVELSNKTKNTKEEILGEPDCAKEQPSKVDVTVLETRDKWFGVTYKEDKQIVIDSFKALVEAGVYKEKLFS